VNKRQSKISGRDYGPQFPTPKGPPTIIRTKVKPKPRTAKAPAQAPTPQGYFISTPQGYFIPTAAMWEQEALQQMMYMMQGLTGPPRDLPKSDQQGLLIGFRYWTIREWKLGPIASSFATYSWMRGPNTATCLRHTDHIAPASNCHCGFNLRAEPSALTSDLNAQTASDVILGACLAWGRILMHGTAGARVQHARPILLAYDPTWTKAKQGVVKGLAQDYDCRTVPVSYPDVERGVCDELLQAAREYGKLMGEMETDAKDTDTV
jgi:hypothetical protein